MAADHDCMDSRQRIVLNEGDDVFVEQCGVCGKIRYESNGVRPMAWFATPNGSWPWEYAYADPHNDPEASEIWRLAPAKGEGETDGPNN